MPLSSLSGPSFGSASSGAAIIALASSCRAANEAESVLPKSAGGRARKIRPKGPSNKRELRDRFAPRTPPCARATRGAFINTPLLRDCSTARTRLVKKSKKDSKRSLPAAQQLHGYNH